MISSRNTSTYVPFRGLGPSLPDQEQPKDDAPSAHGHRDVTEYLNRAPGSAGTTVIDTLDS